MTEQSAQRRLVSVAERGDEALKHRVVIGAVLQQRVHLIGGSVRMPSSRAVGGTSRTRSPSGRRRKPRRRVVDIGGPSSGSKSPACAMVELAVSDAVQLNEELQEAVHASKVNAGSTLDFGAQPAIRRALL
ncbi:MAG: hypothetical protein ACR2JG_10060 [Geodermatophilaceae bacterium]